jgi:hypothetical protein
MIREFIEVPLFTRRWSEIGLTVEHLLSLQVKLLDNPQAGRLWRKLAVFERFGFLLRTGGKAAA